MGLLSKAPRSSHFAQDEAKLASLLREAKEFKGESLWQDAWRRLKRNRGAFWSLVFLCIFGLISALAPLWPLPSPMALALAGEPQPPQFPWSPNPRLPENLPAAQTPEFGSTPTRSMGSFADDGWAHRTQLDFVRSGEVEAAEPTPALLELVREVSGRKPVAHVKAGDEPGTLLERIAVPYLASDRQRVSYTRGTLEANVEADYLRADDGYVAWYRFALPDASGDVGDVRFEAGRRYLDLLVTPADATADTAPNRYRVELEAIDKTQVESVRWSFVDAPDEWLGDGAAPAEAAQEAPADASEASDPDSDEGAGAAAADPELSPASRLELLRSALGTGDENLELKDASGELVVARRSDRATRELASLAPALETRIAEQLDTGAVDGVTLLGSNHIESTWELKLLDPLLMRARTAMFGLWQTGPLLGTDSKGRDLLSRIVWGSRISIQVSVVATLFSLLIGVTYGAFSGFIGGRTDNFMMRVVDVLYAVPFIFVVIFLVTLLNEYRTELADFGIDRLVVFYVVIGAIYWLTMARVVRGQVLSLKNQEFVEAARVTGASTNRILFVHLVPNVLSIVIVYLTLTIPSIMLFEAFLSFLGLGIEPPKVSWGLLALDGTEAISAIKIFWWVIVFPSLAMGSTLLALNVLGDGLRDALDPKLRGKD